MKTPKPLPTTPLETHDQATNTTTAATSVSATYPLENPQDIQRAFKHLNFDRWPARLRHIALEIFTAYLDQSLHLSSIPWSHKAHPQDHCRRSFFCPEPLSHSELKALSKKLIGPYNSFDPDALGPLIPVFGKQAKYFIARENSPCIYVKPIRRVWLVQNVNIIKGLAVDEFSYEPELDLFRLWWD